MRLVACTCTYPNKATVTDNEGHVVAVIVTEHPELTIVFQGDARDIYALQNRLQNQSGMADFAAAYVASLPVEERLKLYAQAAADRLRGQ